MAKPGPCSNGAVAFDKTINIIQTVECYNAIQYLYEKKEIYNKTMLYFYIISLLNIIISIIIIIIIIVIIIIIINISIISIIIDVIIVIVIIIIIIISSSSSSSFIIAEQSWEVGGTGLRGCRSESRTR